MPSFDVVSKVDPQTVENALNVARKEITTRYDFQGSMSVIELNKKDLLISITTENELRIKAIVDILVTRGAKQGIDPRSYDLTKDDYASGATRKKEITVKNGLDKEALKKIAKSIKETGLKVQTQQMDDLVRVTAKKIDDLQAVISHLKSGDFGYPLQFINMKS